jgi:heptosyltransferase-2
MASRTLRILLPMAMHLNAYSTIAVIQTAFLGDVALSLFFLEELRACAPHARILFVTTPASASLAGCSTSIDEVIVFDKRGADSGVGGMVRLSALLKKRGVDLVFGLQRSLRTSVVARLCGARTGVGFKNAAASWLYSHRVEWNLGVHETQRNHALLSVFDDTLDAVVPMSIPALQTSLQGMPDDALAQEFSGSTNAGQKYIVLAPGSVWATKRWPEEHWITLATKLVHSGHKVFVLGGAGDQLLCARIAGAAGAMSVSAEDTALTLPQSLRRIQQADLVVTNDSAPTHLAALAGTRTLTIYGSTIPGFGFGPRGSGDRIVENESLSCRPCGIHGRRECPLGTLECLQSISAEQVFDVCCSMIA